MSIGLVGAELKLFLSKKKLLLCELLLSFLMTLLCLCKNGTWGGQLLIFKDALGHSDIASTCLLVGGAIAGGGCELVLLLLGW